MSRIADDSADLAVMLNLCETLDTARSLGVYLLIKYKDYKSYLDLVIDPRHYACSLTFEKDYLVTKLLSKWKGFEIGGLDPRVEALSEWESAERICLQTNSRFRANSVGGNPRADAILYRAQCKIRDLLGPVPSLNSWFSECTWSAGSTFDLRLGTDFTQKMTSRFTVTRGSRNYFLHLIGHDPHWFFALTGVELDGPCCLHPRFTRVVRGNKHTTVPKSSKTDRNICIEPTANIYLQKGIGSILRRKLKTRGIDLDDQTTNQSLAGIAHKAKLATIDLKSASDTVSRELVASLLPLEWYLLLDDLRSQSSRFNGEWRYLSKFSSMGNGFTFELETLIFWALASSVCEETGLVTWYTSVYGDDIVIPRAAYPLLSEVLTYCGFIVNESKSFASGQFFESCGKHYFGGKLVTPSYQKEISDRREEIIRAHNRLKRWESRSNVDLTRPLRLLRKRFRAFGDRDEPKIPVDAVDDGGFLVPRDYLGKYDRNHGYRCVVYRPVSTYHGGRQAAFLAYKLRLGEGIQSSDKRGHGYLSNSRATYRYRRAYYH